jgi:hypothetical protein
MLIPHWYMYFCDLNYGKFFRISLPPLYNAIRGILFRTPKNWRSVFVRSYFKRSCGQGRKSAVSMFTN